MATRNGHRQVQNYVEREPDYADAIFRHAPFRCDLSHGSCKKVKHVFAELRMLASAVFDKVPDKDIYGADMIENRQVKSYKVSNKIGKLSDRLRPNQSSLSTLRFLVYVCKKIPESS